MPVADVHSRRSLRRTLLIAILATVALVWAATSVVSYVDTRHEIDELLDAHLAQSASLLVAQAGADMEEIDVEHAPKLHRYGRRVAFQFWEGGTILRLHSVDAPNSRLSTKETGFSDALADGVRWRVFSDWDADHHFLVQVAERLESRADIAATIGKNLMLPLAVALPVLALLIWFGIDRALQPLRLLSQQIARRAPDNLAPVELATAPSEVGPIVANLNRLFGRVQASIDNERRFTADAAHELRTPLAALRAQAQVARGSVDDAERARALDNVIVGCDRAAHLIEQLLTLARLEPETFRARHEPCDLREVVQGTLADIAPAALSKNIDIALASGPPAIVAGDRRLLGILVRNIVDNAIRYSPPNTHVQVDVGQTAGVSSLTVADEGSGVPQRDRDRLGRRFDRLEKMGADGSGLGLSIVRRIAALHSASLDFGEGPSGKGLRVTIAFGGQSAPVSGSTE